MGISPISNIINLSGKVALVTGATKGIGLAISTALAAAGAEVVISSRRQDACNEVAQNLMAEGLEAKGIAANVGRSEQVSALVDQTITAFGRLDILVCNAAVNPSFGPLSDMDDTAWDKIFRANVFGSHQLAKLCAPFIAQQGSGSIILLASIAGMMGNKNIGAYGVSKAANAALARNLAVEWGDKGIRANAIAPGLVVTDFAKALWEDKARADRLVDATPLGRLGQSEDIAGMALFLASDLSKFVTGQTLVVDGGLTVNDLLA